MEGFDTEKLISYSTIFPYQEHKLEDLLKAIPSKKAIEFTSNILFRLGGKAERLEDFYIFCFVCERLNKNLYLKLTNFLQNKDLKNYTFFDKTSLLILLQFLIESHNDDENNILESKDDLSNFYIAYLICCDERLRLRSNNLTEVQNIQDKISLGLPELLRLYDSTHQKIFQVEFMRFYYFMTFCEDSKGFKPYLEKFLKEKGFEKWDKYCRFILDTYLDLSKGYTNVIILDKNDYRFSLINSLTLKISDFKRYIDFTSLREKPVYSVEENRYVVLYIGFFIDKLYQSFLFDFASVLIYNSSFPEIKNYPTLKQKVGNDYSEKYLFYTVMKGCFEKQSDKLIEGEALKKLLKDKEPDYYIRNGNNIFLFEFKDVAFNAETKHCENIVTIKEQLCELFVLSTKEKEREGSR